jgi:hypothetical protein
VAGRLAEETRRAWLRLARLVLRVAAHRLRRARRQSSAGQRAADRRRAGGKRAGAERGACRGATAAGGLRGVSSGLRRRGRARAPYRRLPLSGAPSHRGRRSRSTGGEPPRSSLRRRRALASPSRADRPPVRRTHDHAFVHEGGHRSARSFLGRLAASDQGDRSPTPAGSRPIRAHSASLLTAVGTRVSPDIAGPSRMAPLVVKREPWHGQSHVRSAALK